MAKTHVLATYGSLSQKSFNTTLLMTDPAADVSNAYEKFDENSNLTDEKTKAQLRKLEGWVK